MTRKVDADNLYAEIKAELQDRERIATAAAIRSEGWAITTNGSDKAYEAFCNFASAHGPLDALHRYEAGHRTLELHVQVAILSGECARCAEPWPCEDIKNLMYSLRLET